MDILLYIWAAGCAIGALLCFLMHYVGWRRTGKFQPLDFKEVACIVFVMVMFWPILVMFIVSFAMYMLGVSYDDVEEPV